MNEVWIPGRPVPWSRTSVNRQGRRFTPPRMREWKESAQWYLKQLGRTDGFVALDLDFTTDGVRCAIEGSEFTRQKHLRGDLDNYAKAVMDAAQGIVFENDRQVVHINARFSESLGLHVVGHASEGDTP